MGVFEQLSVSDGAMSQLSVLRALVEKWTPRINLVSKGSVSEIWERHFEDSAVLCLEPLLSGPHWVDLGAGGGFPGLVVAVILRDKGFSTKVTLVESDLRKATFLREAARQMNLSVDVVSERAENLATLQASVVSARALAPLEGLCVLADRHLAPGGVCVFPKGARFSEEVDVARKSWLFELETRENLNHKGSALLLLRNLRRAE